jgi:hypothetical protein
MVETIRAISQRTAGDEYDLDLAVVSTPGAADRDGLLGWEMRNFTKVRYVDTPSSAAKASLIVADALVSDPIFDSEYLGENFPIQARQSPSEPTPQALTGWWLNRAWPTEFSRSVTVWVRADVHNLIKQR